MSTPLRYFAIYKPYGYLSQFTKEVPEHRTLGDLFAFPPDVYPVGRLDKDSEGLLILTNDRALNHKLLDPEYGHERSYFAQVEGLPRDEDLQNFRRGLVIRINKKDYTTRPAQIELLSSAPTLPDRNPPIRFRKNVPTSWLNITLTEGKNRQVRRMCAKIGYPTLRLVRHSIKNLEIGNMQPGDVVEFEQQEISTLLDVEL